MDRQTERIFDDISDGVDVLRDTIIELESELEQAQDRIEILEANIEEKDEEIMELKERLCGE